MALSITTTWEVQTGGNDTNNGGAFDPGQNAGMFTDGAATSANTSAPVFTSASYNFVAGDVGAWVYLSSGSTGATVAGGWYKISSVASNAATLNGTIGQGVLKTTFLPTTVVGCANGASPTVITWSIDYSQQAAVQFTYTDLASVGAGLLVSSVAKPFAKQQVGNCIVITGGTNFNTGRYVITSVAAGVATVVGATNITSAAGISGTGGQGGAVAGIGVIGGVIVAGNRVSVKSGTYSITSATANISGGTFQPTIGFILVGYNVNRGDLGTAPILQASGINTATIIKTINNTSVAVINIVIDGQSLTSIRGFDMNTGYTYLCVGKNLTNSAFITSAGQSNNYYACSATGCSTQPAFVIGKGAYNCESYSNTSAGFSSGFDIVGCLSYNNSGATTDGFINANDRTFILNCTAYGNGRDGFRATNDRGSVLSNCLSESNTGFGFNFTATSNGIFSNCSAYNNTGGNKSTSGSTGVFFETGFITGTSSFFVNAASSNFALNNTAGGGATVRGSVFTYPSGNTISYLDIGATQHKDSGGSGSGFFYS